MIDFYMFQTPKGQELLRLVSWQVDVAHISSLLNTCMSKQILNNGVKYFLIPTCVQINGFVQERRNSSALAVELRLSCTNTHQYYCYMYMVLCSFSYVVLVMLF